MKCLICVYVCDVSEIICGRVCDWCRRSEDGRTAIHAAAFSGTVDILRLLVDHCGDLRLHDYAGNSTRDWAASRPPSRRRTKILDYLNKAKLTAINNSTRDFMELSMHNKYDSHISVIHMHCEQSTHDR